MKKKTTRIVSVTLILVMLLTTVLSLTGCGKKEEPPVLSTINVSSEELAPEITDEDLGITRVEPSELFKIVGYQSWEGYNFLVLKKNTEESLETTTVQIEDKDLYRALYNARLKILLNVSYTSVSQDDKMYSDYALGLRSLGDKFYELGDNAVETKTGDLEEEAESAEDDTISLADSENDALENEEVLEMVEENTETNSESEAETVTEGENEEQASETEETPDVSLTDEEALEEIAKDNPELAEAIREGMENGESLSPQSYDDMMENGWQESEAQKNKEKQQKLQNAIDEYMESISLYRATQTLVYTLDGELLGTLTAEKINDYLLAFEEEPQKYEAKDGIAYVSDLEDGVEYSFSGEIVDENGTRNYVIKNDTKKPIIAYLSSEADGDSIQYVFEQYMPTSESLGWYLNENQIKFSSTEETYNVKIERVNSDSDLANRLAENTVYRVKEMSDEVITINSEYAAIVNETDYPLFMQADTGDSMVLPSMQAVGVHRSAYSSINLWFNGVEGTDENGIILDE